MLMRYIVMFQLCENTKIHIIMIFHFLIHVNFNVWIRWELIDWNKKYPCVAYILIDTEFMILSAKR